MQLKKTLGWTAVLGLAISPTIAFADDDTATAPATTSISAHEQCIKDCDSAADSSSTATPYVAPKKTKKIGANTGAGSSAVAPATGGAASVNVNVNPGDVDAKIDAARAEERARAAEQTAADEQKAQADHQADIDRARMDEHNADVAKSEADMAAMRADEDRKLADQRALDAKAAKKSPISSALLTPIGVYGSVGGGYTNFTQPSTAADTNGGGFWDARLGVGTRSILGLEADYQGGARNISALGLNDSAYLVNNGVEGLVRLNVPITTNVAKSIVEPYAFGGAGWQHYSLGNVTTNTSDVRQNDDILDVPMGVGLQLGMSGVTLDGRVTYRQAFFSDLLGSSNTSFAPTSLNNWGAGASLGFEF